MLKRTRWTKRVVVIAVVGFSFGLAGVVGESSAQSEGMKKDDTMMKTDDKMMKDDKKADGMKMEDTKKEEKAMKKDDKMMKDDKAMEKKQ